MNAHIHRLDAKGGVLSAVELSKIISYAEVLGLDAIHFGSRQDIIFPAVNASGTAIKDHEEYTPDFFEASSCQNISSSYVSIDIFNATVWLRGTTYLYILEEFNYQPSLKINIVDPKQQIVPLFSGDLNFIASDRQDYWYLFLKLPGWEEVFYPVLIFTWDIAKVAQMIEKIYQKVKNVDELFLFLNENLDTNNRNIEKPLQVTFNPFPYYEGMNKMSTNQYWLGLYWRNNRYDLKFLKTLCDFCVDHRIGKICLTPWKSFIIKGIAKGDKLALEKLLGIFGINVRHSALELNWHLPVGDEAALQLKKYLVANFDQKDISTYGLTFAITHHHDIQKYFTSIVIKVMPGATDATSQIAYQVLYAQNFDPNTRVYKVYAQDITQENLPDILLELTKTYFANLGEDHIWGVDQSKPQKEELEIEVHQCNDCKTIYDPTIGDPGAGIPKGTDFESLPETYSCPLCGSSKDNFELFLLKIVD